MRLNDSQLPRCYESNRAASVNAPGEIHQIGVLLALHETYRMLAPPHSARVHETINHLRLPEARPALRRWYQHANGALDTAALAFRDHLNRLAGERLEAVEDNPHNQN